MTITAKFASTCPCCQQRIVPGVRVEWTRGQPARHLECAASPATARPATDRALVRGTRPVSPTGRTAGGRARSVRCCPECGDAACYEC